MSDERRSNECEHKFEYTIGETSPGIFIIFCTECNMVREKHWVEMRSDDKKKIRNWVGCS